MNWNREMIRLKSSGNFGLKDQSVPLLKIHWVLLSLDVSMRCLSSSEANTPLMSVHCKLISAFMIFLSVIASLVSKLEGIQFGILTSCTVLLLFCCKLKSNLDKTTFITSYTCVINVLHNWKYKRKLSVYKHEGIDGIWIVLKQTCCI